MRFAILAILLIPMRLAAQTPAYATEIRGTVVDAATGSPVAGASVSVRATADSALAGAAVSRADGAFRIAGVRPGSYVLRAASLGYGVTPAAVTLPAASSRVDVGRVRLTAAAIGLGGITATAERAAVTMAADRTSYAAAQLAPAAGATAADVLRRVPSIEVDAEGRVSLRGDPNVVVQVNGRATGLSAAQLAIFLRQLPASSLQKVDVIPNPSARYDPEGMSGIVDLTLRSRADLGASGGATLSAGTADKYAASGNLGWQRGPATLFGALSYTTDQHPQSASSLRRALDGDAGPSLAQSTVGDARQRAVTLNGSGELKLGARDVLSSTLLLSRQTGGGASTSLYRTRDVGGALLSRRAEFAESDARRTWGDASVTFEHTFAAERGKLTVLADYFRTRGATADVFDRTPPAADLSRADATERTRRDWAATNQRALLQADLALALAPALRLEAGYRGMERRMDQDASTVLAARGAGGWAETSRQAQGLRYDQSQQAAYGLLTRRTGRVQLQAGLRAEVYGNTFAPDASADAFRTRGVDLFPSALAAFTVGEGEQVRASYSRRVQRPEIRTLAPWRSYDDPQHATVGNPYLRPEYTDAFELGWQRSGRAGSIQLTPYLRRTTRAIGPRRAVESDGVTVTTYANYASRLTYGADANGSLRGRVLSGFGGVSVFRMVVDAGNVEPGKTVGALAWSARASGTWRPMEGTEVQGTMGYRAPFASVAGRFGAYVTSDLAVRRALPGAHASLSLRVTDPLGLTRYALTGVDEETTRHFGARAAYLGVSWTFGHAPRVRAPAPDPAQNRPADPATD